MDATDALNEKLDGTYQGIGVRIGLNDKSEIYVYEVFDDLPAKKAGILKNDIIKSIDGVSLEGKSTEDAVNIIQNSKKDKFKIDIVRNGINMSFEVERK